MLVTRIKEQDYTTVHSFNYYMKNTDSNSKVRSMVTPICLIIVWLSLLKRFIVRPLDHGRDTAGTLMKVGA